jgi:hypothetical protein
MISTRTRYRCTYCGCDEIRETLASWELKNHKCSVCGQSEFKTKRMAEGGNSFGYDEQDKEEPHFFD